MMKIINDGSSWILSMTDWPKLTAAFLEDEPKPFQVLLPIISHLEIRSFKKILTINARLFPAHTLQGFEFWREDVIGEAKVTAAFLEDGDDIVADDIAVALQEIGGIVRDALRGVLDGELMRVVRAWSVITAGGKIEV